jgi:chaperone LolA
MKSLLCLSMFLISTISFAEFLPTSFSAKFEQEYISSLKGKVKKGRGSIDYKYPGNIRFETETPSHILFVTNGKKTWYYTFPFIEGEMGELSTNQRGSSMFTKFFDSLKNGLTSNNLYEVKQEKDLFLVSFKPASSKDMGLKAARLKFINISKPDFNSLESIELVFPDNKKSLMKLSEIKLNTKFDETFFVFTAPKNTKVIK